MGKDKGEDSVRTRQFLALGLAGLVACACLLLLPPGLGTRLQNLCRYVTQPAQAWSDCGVRVSRAVLGDVTDADGEETMESLRMELAAAKLEVRTANAGLEAAEAASRRLGVDLSPYRRAFTLAMGRVIRRDPLVSYYETLMLDIGTKQGVKSGQYVVAIPPVGEREFPRLVGMVKRVSSSSCVVELVSHEGVAIPCGIPSRGVDAVLMGQEQALEAKFPALERHGGRLVLSHPLGRRDETVVCGDKVYTSGLGDNAFGVSGVYVGKVVDIQPGDDGSPTVFMEPAVELSNLSHLLVILGKERKP